MTVRGKEKSTEQSKLIVHDVSKYLYFCNWKKIDGRSACDLGNLEKFIDALKENNIRAGGIAVKILRIRNYIDFLTGTSNSSKEFAAMTKFDKDLKAYCSYYSKKRAREGKEKKTEIEEIVGKKGSIDRITTSQVLIKRYEGLLNEKSGRQLSREDYTFARRFVVMQLVYR